ncbi:MAG TPA: hypothetical protein VG676_16440 [Chitinophagaceae bacterium]|jgi:hypothetical protein|nr:hypothetical protein [Chitinophagaceae bacterium]
MKFILTSILFVFSILVKGQDTVSTQLKGNLHFIVYAGLNSIETRKINLKLKSLGYETLSTSFSSIGMGFKYGNQKRFGGINISLFMRAGTQNSSYNALQLEGYFNYTIIDKNKFSIAPGLGFGLQKIKADFTHLNSSNNIDTLFLVSGNHVQLRNSNPVAGISTIVHIKKLDKQFILERLFSHILIGYKLGLKNTPWKADAKKLANSPKDKLNSFNVQVFAEF